MTGNEPTVDSPAGIDRHRRFVDLHASGCFVLPNPWDVGSARVMAALGAEALATTSAGFAFTLGYPDGNHLDLQTALEHSEALVGATPLPVSADLENGYCDEPDEMVAVIQAAAEAGLSGCSIEDTQQDGQATPYTRTKAIARIEAAVETANSLGRPFVLCARADGVMNGRYDLAEAVARIEGYAAVGAHCVYVPLPGTVDDLQTVIDSVEVPVNALAVGPVAAESLTALQQRGVRRVSLGSAVARLTQAALVEGVRGSLSGDFTTLRGGASGIDELLMQGAERS